MMGKISKKLSLVICLIPCVEAFASISNVINLEDKYGSNIEVTSINDKGQMAGITYKEIGSHTITIFDGDSTKLLPSELYFSNTHTDINNLGQVVTSLYFPDGPNASQQRGALWDGEKWNYLDTLGGHQSTAASINDSGQIVGVATTSRGTGFNQTRATLWDKQDITNLRALSGQFLTEAHAINNNGYISGWSLATIPGSPAVIWGPDGSVTQLENMFQYSTIYNTDINIHNVVVGTVHDSATGNHALLWDGLTPIDIGSLAGLNTSIGAINDNGFVVGTSFMNDSLSHAFIWDDFNGMVDLNHSLPTEFSNQGWVLTQGIDINNSNQILVTGYNNLTDDSTTFLLNHISPVPEPTTWAMLLAGLSLVGFMARARAQVE